MAETTVLEEKQQKKPLEASAPANMGSGLRQWLWGDDQLVTLTWHSLRPSGGLGTEGLPDPQDGAGLAGVP